MNKRLQIERPAKDRQHPGEPLPLDPFPSEYPGLRLQLVGEDTSIAPGRGRPAGQRTPARLTEARTAGALAQLLAAYCGPHDHRDEQLEKAPHDYRTH